MDPSRRKELEKLAIERLHDPANQDPSQPWAYAFGSGHTLFGWCSWEEYNDRGPATYGAPDDLDLPWSKERRRQLENDDTQLSNAEWRRWHREMCWTKARQEPEVYALIKPMKIENSEAYEVWLDRFREMMPCSWSSPVRGLATRHSAFDASLG
jgi:hypothetical protein